MITVEIDFSMIVVAGILAETTVVVVEVGLLMHSVNFVTNLDMMLFTAIIDKRRIMFILFLH